MSPDSCINANPVTYKIVELEVNQSTYDYQIQFNKQLSSQTLTQLDDGLEISLSKLNSTQFNYTIALESSPASFVDAAPTLSLHIFNISEEFTNNFLLVKSTMPILGVNGY